MKKTAILPALALALFLAPCASFAAPSTPGSYSLDFDATKYTVQTSTLDGKTFSYRAYEGIVYVQHPLDPAYETINIYVPVEYYSARTVGGYTIDNAPIFFPNSVGGYMPGAAAKPGLDFEGKPNALVVALSRGLIVAAPGARGRTLQDGSGRYTGKAPAAIVDLKAAVRYLRLNDKLIPGSSERIISNGTSAGGGLSALLGASGDNADYEPYLKALGAANARDDVYAVSAYCPITNLDNADSAYEWLLGGLTETKASTMGPPPAGAAAAATGAGAAMAPPAGMPAAAPTGAMGAAGATGATLPFGAPPSSSGPMTAEQLAVSARLKALFPAYLDGLGLRKADGTALALDASGDGSFRDYLKSLLIASAQTALKGGADLSKLDWVTIKDGVVTDIDWAGYVKYCGRKKAAPSFDGLDLSSGENSLFGTMSVNAQHFTAFGLANDASGTGAMASADLVRMMNPMAYIGAKGTTTSKYWRIRHGTVDSDTAIAIPAILATRLGNGGYSVDFALPWDRPHSGDYDLEELFTWIDGICR